MDRRHDNPHASFAQHAFDAVLIGEDFPFVYCSAKAGLIGMSKSLAAEVASRAAEHFNKALRTFYFGLAALSWFLQPYLFMVLTALVVVVVYRREFQSHTLSTLGQAGSVIPGG